jgi:hypothetical protein
VKNTSYDETLRKDADVFEKRELRIRMVKNPKDASTPEEIKEQISIDPEQIGNIVQEVIIQTAISIGAIVIAKKILDIAGEVIVTAAKAKFR